MREGYTTHVADSKKKAVAEFTEAIESSPIVGVVNLENLPSPQVNLMRKKLRAHDVTIKMTKARLIKRAIEQAKKKHVGIEELEKHLQGMPALMFTKENPFSLFKLIKKNKSKAPAKAGQILPSDVKISAGPTNFAPGPVISELASFGIKTKVEDGKLTIIQDTVIAKEGDVVSDKLASMLMRLDVKPMEIGLDVVAIYEQGTIFTKKVLDIDEEQFLADLEQAGRWAFNLAVEATYPTADTVNLFISKAYTETKALALEAHIPTSDTITDLLGQAERQMLSIKSAAGV